MADPDPTTLDSMLSKDKRVQGLRLKLPGGAELEVRGLTVVMYAFFGLISVNSWTLWKHDQTAERLVTAINIQTCMMISNANAEARSAQYTECYRLYNDWQKGK